MSQRIPKALKDAANRIVNPDGAEESAVKGMSEAQLNTMNALNEAMISFKMVQKYARRTVKNKDASEKEKMNAANLLLKSARELHILAKTTAACWQKAGYRPPAAKALRKPPDLTMPAANGNGMGNGQT